MENDKELVLKIKNHDEKAFQDLYDKYHRLFESIAFNMLKNTEDANDVVNETFETIYHKIDTHDDNKSFKYWALQILKNNCLQLLNNKKKTDDFVNNYDGASFTNPDDSFLIESIKHVLNEEEYNVFIYHTIYDLSYMEIEEVMNISKSKAQRLFEAAKEKLKKNL